MSMKKNKIILAVLSIISAVVAMFSETFWHFNETINRNENHQTKNILEVSYIIIMLPIIYAVILLIRYRKITPKK